MTLWKLPPDAHHLFSSPLFSETWKQKLSPLLGEDMDPSLETLFSLCSVFCILFSTTTANHSSDKQILSCNDSILGPNSVHSGRGEHFSISTDKEMYLTSPWLTTFLPSILTLAVVFGFPLNLMAVLMFVVKIKMKKPAVVYMVNLATADLFLLSVLPFKIFYYFSGQNWPFGPEMCNFLTSAFFCNTFCSIMLMTAISVDRCLAVSYPMQSLSWLTVRRASLVCAVIWILAIAGVIYLMTTELTLKIPQLNITICADALDAAVIVKSHGSYVFVLSILLFLIPLFISTVCYVSIIRKLSLSNVNTKPGKKRRAILLSAAVMSSFVLCFGPSSSVAFIQFFHSVTYFDRLCVAGSLTISFATINCCLDPLIYYYASSECKKQVWNLLCPENHSDVEKDIQAKGNIC